MPLSRHGDLANMNVRARIYGFGCMKVGGGRGWGLISAPRRPRTPPLSVNICQGFGEGGGARTAARLFRSASYQSGGE